MTDVREKLTLDEGALDELYGLSDDLVSEVRSALEGGSSVEEVLSLIAHLHAADVADLLEQLSTNDRDELLELLGGDLDAEVWVHLDEAIREDAVEDLDTSQLVGIVNELDSDDAVDLLEDLDAKDRRELLDAIPADDRAIYEQSLSYPEDSAGRLMQREMFTAPSFWTVGQAIDYMRDDKVDLPDDFYNIMVVDPAHKPLGVVKLSKLMRTDRDSEIAKIMWEDVKVIPVTMDQEDVAFLFRQYAFVEAPVVDDSGRLVGVITVDDIVAVLDEEHEEDILKMGGVKEDDLYSDVVETTRLRFSWLLVNLLTAVFASIVISMFEETLEQLVALAILMPIVASMGGNAGTQTLTVAVRALATNELTPSNALRVVWKEALVGGVNGVVFAILMGALAWGWFDDILLGAVIASAMIINMLAAGMAGTMIPLCLDRFGKDPAIASIVFLTTITDVVGFLSFLGLSALVLL